MQIHWNVLLAHLGAASVLTISGCQDTKRKADDNQPRSNEILSVEQIRRAIELKNRGLAHLENREWSQADAASSELASLLPENQLAVRNLAIARVLAIVDLSSILHRSRDRQEYEVAVSAAADAVTVLRKRSIADRPLANMIQGMLLVHDDAPGRPRFVEGLSLLREAAIDSKNRLDFWFAVAQALDGHEAFTESPELLQTLQTCSQIAPENLYVLQRLLERQALTVTSANPETRQLALQVTETLKKIAALLGPLNQSILKQRRIDLNQTITDALASFDGRNVDGLIRTAMMTKNLLLPELPVLIDARTAVPNLFRDLLYDFDADFQKQAQAAGVLPSFSATVVKGFKSGSGLPDVTGVTDVEFMDMDLDGKDDLVVASQGRIYVYGRVAEESSEWSLLMKSPAGTNTLTKFLLADLDHDFDKEMPAVRWPMILRDQDGDRKIVTDPGSKHRWFDTDLDVVAWSTSGIVLLRNQLSKAGTRTLELTPLLNSISETRDVVAADLEPDGDLDLVAATSAGLTLLRNIDGTNFETQSEEILGPDYGIDALAIGDWNRDMAMDILGTSTERDSGVLQNQLHNRFRWTTEPDGLSEVPQGAQVRLADFDGNLSWDFLTAGPSGIQMTFTQTSMIGTMSALRQTIVSTQPVSGIETVDVDNDGSLDIVAVSDAGASFFRGRPDGTFEDLSRLLPADASGNGLCATDFDDDGDTDLVLTSSKNGSLTLLTNDGGDTNHWMDVVVRATGEDPQFPANQINMHAIGSVIELRAGAAYQAHVIDKPRMRLGLGQAISIDAIRVVWTDGTPQNIVETKLLQPRIGILVPQILKTSCPYIYTWTGERFEFFSDCLWAAPLGLIQANGEPAPTREWEYLLIPGERLAAREDRYVLQITEELWEATYLDEVKLVAVDHPDEVSIFTNEKVGSAEMAAHRVHTVRTRYLPSSVVDADGNNLLPGLTSQDGDYVQPFRSRIIQGLTEPWLMEFDPGLADRPKTLRLVLIGWVFPTNASINVAIQQSPQLDPPEAPAIEVRDADGGWITRKPFIGFPGGKTKAMVIDLSDAFLTDDFRFRLRSSMELYWDAAFFIVDEDDAETRIQQCQLSNAHLHYRGFSRRTYDKRSLFRTGHAPEGYDYDSVTKDLRWPAMMGRFTRFGDVAELTQQQDDRMVVMGAGDELTLEFAVPPQPAPQGWKRDFVLYNVGWDKDADLSTIYGQSSEPYPFRAMTQYPFAAEESEPDSPEYMHYLEHWQTRRYSPRRFWSTIRDGGNVDR